MSQAKGYAATAVKAPLAPYSFERREPREHDAAIEIRCCGICHTDIHQVRDVRYRFVIDMASLKAN